MNGIRFSFFIARRYFIAPRSRQQRQSLFRAFLYFLISPLTFSKSKVLGRYRKLVDLFISQNFIRILSNISMVGVSIGTMAMVTVLSVFNGLEDYTRRQYSAYNPELRITPKTGKSFVYQEDIKLKISQIEGVQHITEIIEDNALLRYDDRQKVVAMKGVSQNFLEQYRFDTLIVYGAAELLRDSIQFALLGAGVHQELSIRLKDEMNALQIWYPKRGKTLSLDPEKAFNRRAIRPSGVFAIDQQYDQNTIIVPLDFANDLLEYGQRRTSLEVRTSGNIYAVQEALQQSLGADFEVKTLEQQQASILRAVEIERLFVFVTFVFVLALASFNVFFSLAMLAIEKKKDIAILFSIGATKNMVRFIFLLEGAMIAFSGAVIGLVLGFVLCFVQQEYKIFSVEINGMIFETYPVRIQLVDFVLVSIVVIGITLLASFVPANNASKVEVKDHF